MPLELSDVLLIHRGYAWCEDVKLHMRRAGVVPHWAASFASIAEALEDGPIDGVILDTDVFQFDRTLKVLHHLTHASPAPVVLVFSNSGLSSDQAFELGRRGARRLLPSRPEAHRALPLLESAAATPPVLAPQVRAAVGHMTQSDIVQEVRSLFVDQAVGTSRGNKSKASRLLKISRQAIQHTLRRDEQNAN